MAARLFCVLRGTWKNLLRGGLLLINFDCLTVTCGCCSRKLRTNSGNMHKEPEDEGIYMLVFRVMLDA